MDYKVKLNGNEYGLPIVEIKEGLSIAVFDMLSSEKLSNDACDALYSKICESSIDISKVDTVIYCHITAAGYLTYDTRHVEPRILLCRSTVDLNASRVYATLNGCGVRSCGPHIKSEHTARMQSVSQYISRIKAIPKGKL